MRKKQPPREIDLHPADWDPNWVQPIGNDPRPGEKPHISQEFERDRYMKRYPGEPVLGKNWPILIWIALYIGIMTLIKESGSVSFLIALKSLF